MQPLIETDRFTDRDRKNIEKNYTKERETDTQTYLPVGKLI